MQPHPPQLPTDHTTGPAPKSLKKGTLLLFLILVTIVALLAFLLPKKQVTGQNAPTPTQHSTQSPAYSKPRL